MSNSGSDIGDLLDVMAQLRNPEGGCEWDLKQNFKTIAPYTIEEAYEVADAIEREDTDSIREELGDLLLQVVFHSQIAQDLGLFTFSDVAKTITDKMIHRHPHVFGDLVFDNEDQQKAHWEQLKQEEREKKTKSQVPGSAIDDVAIALPSLTRAEKIQKRASRVGFDWTSLEPVIDKIDEELAELRSAIDSNAGQSAIEDELGDLLFAATNVARHLKIDPEQALKKSTSKFEQRFRYVEEAARADGHELDKLSENSLNQYWNLAKRQL